MSFQYRAFVHLAALLLLAGLVCAGEPVKDDNNRPSGSWMMSGGGAAAPYRITFESGRLTWERGQGIARITADYSVTKDSVVYGVITKVVCTSIIDEKTKEGLPSEDDTFSFRYRLDDDELNVKGIRGKGMEVLFPKAQGRYKKEPDLNPKPKQ